VALSVARRIMFLWQKSAQPHWVDAHEDVIQVHAHGRLVIIRQPHRKRLQLEIACSSRNDARALLTKFGGRIEVIPRDWLERFARADSKPIKIGKRLAISSVGGTLVSRLSRYKGRSHIIIPASMAFGTGEHATTSMALRLLEKLTRHWKRGWSVVDLGTGSGILALAAKRFGAARVVAIDIDPTAISIAKSNARLNRIRGITFQLRDVRKWKSAHEIDVITANLYSGLLTRILWKLKRSGWLILSGILCNQESEFLRLLLRNKIQIISIKRGGKWIAILARSGGAQEGPNLSGGKFLRQSLTPATVKTNAN
jgi:ribosomal protein L11 methyltransferase